MRDLIVLLIHSVTILVRLARRGGVRSVLAESVLLKHQLLMPLSHSFVERLIGTIRREYLDQTLSWTATDLETKLLEFKNYYNEHRAHAGICGKTPGDSVVTVCANLQFYRWREHCHALFQTPMAP
jgi:hypothetical protein